MERHFVTFYSPGTFVSETTTKEISSWDVGAAREMARDIVERYGAKPYGFRFTTRARGDNDLDSKEVAHSGMYHLGGRLESLDEIVQRNDPKDKILISNMRINGWDFVLVNDNSYRITLPFDDRDHLLDPL